MRRSTIRRWEAAPASLLLLLGYTLVASAQEQTAPPLVEAQRAEARGETARAESLYDQALAQRPDDVQALLGRARMRSWLQRFPEAIADYDAVIAREPGNVLAWTGRAWTRAWSKDFDAAKRDFEEIARREPYLLDARKGLAYIALWRGDAADARRQFEALAAEDRGNPDYVLAIAQAAYLEGDLDEARQSYREALALKPGLEAAESGIDAVDAAAIQRRPTLTVLAGRSEFGEEEQTGIRLAQLGMQVNEQMRLWLSHDRGIGFDGFAADRRARDAATTSIGGFFTYAPKFATKLEIGQRDLGEETQPVLSAEQVFFLAGGTTTPKAGIWIADGDAATEWVVSASVHRWLGERIAIEPAVYLGDDGNDREYRGSMLATYTTPARFQIGLGVALGTKDAAEGSRSVDRVFANISAPIGRRATFLFYGWRESTEGFESQTVLAAGASIHL
jgi:tetratricopeptide (TPR) repeat protein